MKLLQIDRIIGITKSSQKGSRKNSETRHQIDAVGWKTKKQKQTMSNNNGTRHDRSSIIHDNA